MYDIFSFLAAIAFIFIALRAIQFVPQSAVLLIERFGVFNRVVGSGWNFLIPFVERPRSFAWTGVRRGATLIDLREQFTEITPQPIFTRDNVRIMADSTIQWLVKDPIKAGYEINDLVGGVIQLTITAMRSVIGELDLDRALTSREWISDRVRVILDDCPMRKWGVKVTRVELRNIKAPEI